MQGKALASTVLVFLLAVVIVASIPWSKVFGAKRKSAAKDNDTASADVPKIPVAPHTMPHSRDHGTVIPMSAYHECLVGLARKLNTANTDIIYGHHEVFCARCGIQFTREALAQLDLFGPGSMFGNVTVIGATQEGNDLRSGRCPKCGSMQIRVVANEARPSAQTS